MQDQGSEFTPDELDRLEDALSALGEPAGRGESSSLPPRLRERLGEYEEILALARDALPLEDVEPAVLAGILAEARQAAPAAAKPEVRGPGLWDRLRRSFALPGLALAGTAALLLWVARPDGEPLPTATEAAPSPAAPEPRREAVPPGAATPNAPAPDLKDMAPEAEAKKLEQADAPMPAAAIADPTADRRALAEPAPAPGKPKAGGYAPTRSKKADVPEEEVALPGLDVPEEKRVDADKESVRDQLERGEAARHKGRCAEAEAEYAAVARSNGPASERARALAGLGLCREASGDASAAQRYYAEARALDADVSNWIRNEVESGLKRATKAKAPTKAKATAEGL